MKRIKSIVLLMLLALLPLQMRAGHGGGESGELDIPEIVLEHLSDTYEWHIAGDVAIPLPIIVRSSETGSWYFCTEHSLAEQAEGRFFFNKEKHGKIYEKMTNGEVVRPIDLSITKAVAQIWIVVFILIGVFLYCGRWYKSRDEKSEAPGGFVGFIEMLVTMIDEDVVRPSVGEKNYHKFGPYLLTAFFFIFTTNIVGLLPVFPGGANVTGNINVTLFLALCTMLMVNLFGNKEYWKEIFWPEVPLPLKPLMIPIECVGIITKPFALMIRLFANMMAGHAVMLSFTCVIFLGWSMGVGFGVGLNIFSVIMLLFMNCLEVLVAFVQAYVFTMLSAVFIGLAHPEHHEE